MAVKLLFEDKESTPSSILLKHSLFGDNIYFSGGCHQILNKLRQIQNVEDTIYVFYDVSPNNKYTVKYYDSLVQEIKSNPNIYGNIYVVPIICIEYYICKFFNKYNYMCVKDKTIQELVDAIVVEFDYNKIPNNIACVSKLMASLEKMYKHIINNQKMQCLLNTFTYDSASGARIEDLRGIFYEDSCNCERRYCRTNCTDNIQLKAERLYAELPVFIVETDGHRELLKAYGINIKHTNSIEIRNNMQKLYNDICENMGLNTIKVVI